jgi:hypothetical protein
MARGSAKKNRANKKHARAQRQRTRTRRTDRILTLVPDAPEPTPTFSAFRAPLPTRPRRTGPLTPTEHAAARAALASAALRLPISAWTWNGSTAQLADGTLLIHNPSPDRTFTAHIACHHGSIHGWPIRTAHDLKAARAITRACERHHAHNTPADNGLSYDWDKAIQRGITASHRVTEGVATARTATTDTQPLSVDEIGAHIAAQLATADTPKEHPQP